MSPAEVVAADSRLLRRYREHGDLQAREQLVQRMASLVAAVARPYRGAGEPEELRQVAWLGLVKAIERFDPGFGVPFRAYAAPTMTGEVLRHLRDHSWAVRPPRRLQERVLAVSRASERLSGALGRSPTPAQIGEELGLGLDEVMEALQAGRAHRAVSLQAPLAGEQGDGGTLGDVLGGEDGGLGYVERLADLRRLRGTLTDRECELLRLRFVEELNQREIAERVGCTQMEVSRTIREALTRLAAAAGRGA
jgi:RNA polymerase sigma-B factor